MANTLGCFVFINHYFKKNTPVLVRVSIGVVNTMAKSSLGRKGIILLTLQHHSSSLKKAHVSTQGRNLEEELMQRLWRSAAY